ncbi:MAG TPA: hypothetical protein VGB83_10115 [Actinomycetota bacterium]
MPALDFAFLADAAEAQPGRKFYVLGGGIDSIGAPRFPVVHPMMSLVMRVLIHPMEAEDEHALDIRLIDSDGHELVRLDGKLRANDPARTGREITVPFVMNLVNTRFDRPGDYSIEILIDGEHAKSLPLRLHQVGAPGQGKA